MYNHAPDNYVCPICEAVQGRENEHTWITQSDIFYRDEKVLGFISAKKIEGNEGHPLIVPVNHFEHIYEIQDSILAHISRVTKQVARALKSVRSCDGVTVLQNNEPAGDQHAFHYHVHVVPRFVGDNFHEACWLAKRSESASRKKYADQLRTFLTGDD